MEEDDGYYNVQRTSTQSKIEVVLQKKKNYLNNKSKWKTNPKKVKHL